MKNLTLIVLFLICSNIYVSFAQCNAPTSISTIFVPNHNCEKGAITITAVTPAIASLPIGDYYEFRLVLNANQSIIIKDWQQGLTFNDVPNGRYNIQTRRFCASDNSYSQNIHTSSVRDVIGTITSTSNGTIINHETCPGNARIKAGAVTINPSYPLLPTSRIEYQLIRASDSTVVHGWQSSDTFEGNIGADAYKYQVRIVCDVTGVSFAHTHANNINISNGVPAAPNITTIEVLKHAQCCNGEIKITATGGSYKQYALVTSLQAADIEANLVTPKQTSNTIYGLCPGTYYVRVWDTCGRYATSSVVINSATAPNMSINTNANSSNMQQYTCDSFLFTYTISNINYIRNTQDYLNMKSWVLWPNGSVDTYYINPNLNSTTNLVFNVGFKVEKFDNNLNPSLPFPQNLSSRNKTFSVFFMDACGNVTSRDFNLDISDLEIEVAQPNPAILYCDSVKYIFALKINTLLTGFLGARTVGSERSGRIKLNQEDKYSIDNGVTWHDIRTSQADRGNLYINLPYNQTINVMISHCGDTITTSVIVPPKAQLTATAKFSELSRNSCNGGEIEISKGDAMSNKLTVEIIAAPPSFTIPPPMEVTFVGNNTTAIAHTNLPLGTYTVLITDSAGVECSRTVTRSFNGTLRPLNLGLNDYNYYSCPGFSGLYIYAPRYEGTQDRNATIEVLEQPVGANIPNIFYGNLYGSTINQTEGQAHLLPELRNLIPGTYRFLVTDSAGAQASCPRSKEIIFTITGQNTLNNDDIVLKYECNNSLTITVTDTLLLPRNISGSERRGWGNYLQVSLYDNNNVLRTTVSGVYVVDQLSGITIATIPANTINALALGTYKLRVYLNADGNNSINDSCTVREFIWEKTATRSTSMSESKMITGCNNNTNSGVIVGSITGAVEAPLEWSLFEGTSINTGNHVAGPQASNIFSGLQVGQPYVLAVSDGCGFGYNYVISNSANFNVFAYNSTNTQCPGDDVSFTAPYLSGATYQWYKDGNLIASIDTNTFTLSSIALADAGEYKSLTNLNGCVLESNTFDLKVDCSALPILLKSFKGNLINNQTHLEWITLSESNNMGFEIEKSTDGKKWNKIGYIASKNSNAHFEQTYNFVDTKPNNAYNYYRLKQIDLDGKFNYSQTVLINLNKNYKEIIVYPNPATQYLIFENVASTLNIQIVNSIGKIIYHQTINEDKKIDIENLESGFYIIQIIHEDGHIQHEKIIKQ